MDVDIRRPKSAKGTSVCTCYYIYSISFLISVRTKKLLKVQDKHLSLSKAVWNIVVNLVWGNLSIYITIVDVLIH